MRKKEVYICVTLYHLYVTLLLISKRGSKGNCVILLNANNEQIYDQFCKLQKTLLQNGYMVNCRLRNRKKDIIGIEGINNRKQYRWVRTQLGGDIDNGFILFNFAWNLQYIYTTANLFFKKCEEAYFVEEGVLVTINPPQPKWKVLLKKLNGTVVDFYKEDKLKGIYVQKEDRYPETWKRKLKYLDLSEIVGVLDEKTKETIVGVFLGDMVQDLKHSIKDGAGIIFTQPLSEDGIVTEVQKIEYYQKIVRFYSRYGRPIIKIHPRDLTKYKFDEKYTILPPFFPSELLSLIDIKFKYAVGICTSAILSADADLKINLNENFIVDKEFELIPFSDNQ